MTTINIRNYISSDEAGWVRCRLLSFLDSSYYDDIATSKETYKHPSLCLVAEVGDVIVGFIDIEYEKNVGDVCSLKGKLGGVIWNLGVLPEYRQQGIASMLLANAKEQLHKFGITRIEVWTQDDDLSVKWYEKKGFALKQSYLNAYIQGTLNNSIIKKYVNIDNLGDVFGVRCFNFEAPIERKSELEQFCYRLHEVRLYERCL